MAEGILVERVERLEHTVQGLEGLPEREKQISQLRSDMRVEFSAFRGEMQAEFAAFRNEMQMGFTAFRNEMQTGFAKLETKIDENWHRTRALHEQLVNQIRTIGEGSKSTPPGGKSSRRTR